MSAIAIDVNDPIELRAAGIRALNSALGADGARVFVQHFFGGRGDYTKEKYERPDLTPQELAVEMDMMKADAVAMGTW